MVEQRWFCISPDHITFTAWCHGAPASGTSARIALLRIDVAAWIEFDDERGTIEAILDRQGH